MEKPRKNLRNNFENCSIFDKKYWKTWDIKYNNSYEDGKVLEKVL